jgi:DNA polymerase-1
LALVIAFDTETDLIRPGRHAPALACLTYQSPGAEAVIVHARDAEPVIRGWLLDPAIRLVGHNVAYDLAVICEAFPQLRPLVFAAYDADRITDTQVRQWLLDNAAGCFRGRPDAKGKWIPYEYTLEALAKRAGGMQLQKDGWRLSYGNFLETPLDQWPARAVEVQAAGRARIPALEAARAADPDNKALAKELEWLREMCASDPGQCIKYPLDDARATLAVYLAQERHVAYLDDQHRQARAYFALYLSSVWGLRTDKEGVDALRGAIEAELEELEEELVLAGLMRVDGSRDTKAAKARMVEVCRRERMAIPRTDAHEKCAKGEDPDACTEHVSLDSDACERSEDELLLSYSHATTLRKVLSNDIVALAGGTLYPVHTRYGFAATGRTTSSKPNIQSQSKRDGIREAFVPRPGKVFIEADFPSLELYTLAQCCVSWLGKSRLAEVLNAGMDPHLGLAAVMLGRTYEAALQEKGKSEVKKARQLAKPANFGRPGGMGVAKFIAATRKAMGRKAFAELFGATPEEQEKKVREVFAFWEQAWPEMPDYFARVNALLDEDTGRAMTETLFTKRVRGNATYCATANNGFQALGADCAKHAAWLLAKACYVDQGSPLFNSRVVAFIHDEFIVETDDGPGMHEAAYELARLMGEGANAYLPDVPIPIAKIEPTAMRRWSKKAETKLDAAGRLQVWMPEAA